MKEKQSSKDKKIRNRYQKKRISDTNSQSLCNSGTDICCNNKSLEKEEFLVTTTEAIDTNYPIGTSKFGSKWKNEVFTSLTKLQLLTQDHRALGTYVSMQELITQEAKSRSSSNQCKNGLETEHNSKKKKPQTFIGLEQNLGRTMRKLLARYESYNDTTDTCKTTEVLTCVMLSHKVVTSSQLLKGILEKIRRIRGDFYVENATKGSSQTAHTSRTSLKINSNGMKMIHYDSLLSMISYFGEDMDKCAVFKDEDDSKNGDFVDETGNVVDETKENSENDSAKESGDESNSLLPVSSWTIGPSSSLYNRISSFPSQSTNKRLSTEGLHYAICKKPYNREYETFKRLVKEHAPQYEKDDFDEDHYVGTGNKGNNDLTMVESGNAVQPVNILQPRKKHQSMRTQAVAVQTVTESMNPGVFDVNNHEEFVDYFASYLEKSIKTKEQAETFNEIVLRLMNERFQSFRN